MLSVDLHDDDVQLPVLVDPVTESWHLGDFVNCGAQSASGTWKVTEQIGADTYPVCMYNWLAIASNDRNRLNQNGSGTNISYTARANTSIADVTWGNFQVGQANGAQALMGLFNDNCWCWEALQGFSTNRPPSSFTLMTGMSGRDTRTILRSRREHVTLFGGYS